MTEKSEAAFERLYREMYGPLLRTANATIHDLHASEDLVQDTFVVAHSKFEALGNTVDLKSWLYGVLRNKIKHELRARVRFAVMRDKLERDPRVSDPDEGGARRDLPGGLTRGEYELLELIYVDGYNAREVAASLNISYDSCRKRIQRAKDKIRRGRL